MSETPSENEAIDDVELTLPPSEAESFENADAGEPVPPVDVIAYNEVRSCADLFRLYASKKMEIQPDFQRDVVWKNDERTRFIDSLVKQLPIPSMCFSLDPRTQRWKVIDGLQRMTSITDFLGPNEWKLSALNDIDPLLRGNTNKSLRDGDESAVILYSAVENVTVPVTVIRCDYTKREHMRYLFTIFHRLNSGGVRLNNQEIRNCIYTGKFNNLLKEFDSNNADWGAIKSRIWGSVSRFRSVEILLRVLAFSARLDEYDGNLADYLNRFMHEHAEISVERVNEFREALTITAQIAIQALGDNICGKISLAIVEAVLVGVMNNRFKLSNELAEALHDRYLRMLTKPAFTQGARYAVSSVQNVRTRLIEATNTFGE